MIRAKISSVLHATRKAIKSQIVPIMLPISPKSDGQKPAKMPPMTPVIVDGKIPLNLSKIVI